MKACKVPPPGWLCTREAGHEGPCAAIQDKYWQPCWDFEACDCFTDDKRPHCMFCGEPPSKHPFVSVLLDFWYSHGAWPYWLYTKCRSAWAEYNLR